MIRYATVLLCVTYASCVATVIADIDTDTDTELYHQYTMCGKHICSTLATDGCLALRNSVDSGFAHYCWCKLGFTGTTCSLSNSDVSSEAQTLLPTLEVRGWESTQPRNDTQAIEPWDISFTLWNRNFDRRTCDDSPCRYPGTISCEPFHHTFECKCRSGYDGRHCEVDTQCSTFACQNGGTCVKRPDHAYDCLCVPGFNGAACQTDVDECASHPCTLYGGHSRCVDEINGWRCDCLPGWTHSPVCETPIDECVSNPCQNGGTCHDYVNAYTCICMSGFQGIHCEENIHCLHHPCGVHGICRTTDPQSTQPIGWFCDGCEDGWYGVNCSRRCPCEHQQPCKEELLPVTPPPPPNEMPKESLARCLCDPLLYSGANCSTVVSAWYRHFKHAEAWACRHFKHAEAWACLYGQRWNTWIPMTTIRCQRIAKVFMLVVLSVIILAAASLLTRAPPLPPPMHSHPSDHTDATAIHSILANGPFSPPDFYMSAIPIASVHPPFVHLNPPPLL